MLWEEALLPGAQSPHAFIRGWSIGHLEQRGRPPCHHVADETKREGVRVTADRWPESLRDATSDLAKRDRLTIMDLPWVVVDVRGKWIPWKARIARDPPLPRAMR